MIAKAKPIFSHTPNDILRLFKRSEVNIKTTSEKRIGYIMSDYQPNCSTLVNQSSLQQNYSHLFAS
jgi:hypothetical protein